VFFPLQLFQKGNSSKFTHATLIGDTVFVSNGLYASMFYRLKELEGQNFTMLVVTQKDSFVIVRLLDSAGNDVMAPPASSPPVAR